MLNFPLVCRFCLIPSEINQTIGIFDGTNELPEKILELTDIKVVNEDGLPQEVCFVCREQLDLSFTFKKQVVRADCMLREYLRQQVTPPSYPGPVITGDLLAEGRKVSDPTEQRKEQKQEVPDLVIENQEKKEHSLNSDEEELVEEKLVNSYFENSHLDEEFNSNRTNSESAYSSAFGEHIVKEEIDEDFAVAMLWPEVLQSKDLEETVRFGIKNVDDLKEENENETESGTTQVKQEEKEAGNIFLKESKIRASDLTDDKMSIHCSDKLKCSCMFCLENKEEIKVESEDSGGEELHNLSESQGLRRSSRPSKVPERHVVPHYSCSKCERMYNDKATLENHEKSHLIIFKCNHCGKKFSNKDHLTKHIQTSHIGKSLKNQCEICGKSYEKRPHLFSHMRSHKSTVHLCEICGKTISLSAYPAHKRSHFNTNSHEVFQCDLCQKKFNNKMALRTHKNSYHGSLKFTCEVCGKQFTTMALMKHHQNSHSGKRDHVCQVCSRAFTLKVTLRTHMRIHTGEMPYSCEKCGRSFTWKTTYRNHVASCKTDKVFVDSNTVNSVQYYNYLQISQNNTQESPIDYSDDAKSKVPTQNSNEAKTRRLRSETRFSSTAMNISEGMKYPYQQPLYYGDDIKSYVKDFKPS